MENARQFEVNLYRRRVGDIVALEVQRGSETVKTTAAIAERPDDPARFAELVDAKQNLIARLGILGGRRRSDRRRAPAADARAERRAGRGAARGCAGRPRAFRLATS